MPKRLIPWLLPIGGLTVGLLLALPVLSPGAPRLMAPPAGVDVKYSPATGIPDWVDGPLPYPLSPAEQADPESAARGVLQQYREMFGIGDAVREFNLVRIESDRLGQTHVRFQQVREGIPVWGHVMLVHLGEAGVLGINGDYQPGLTVDTAPTLSAAEAEARALAADGGIDPQVYAPPQLMIWVDDSARQSYLTWLVKVRASVTGQTGYFVDAHDGRVVHMTPLMAGDLYREVYDMQLKDSLPGKLLATEGTLPRDPGAAAAYKNAGTVYNYFLNTFGRDSYDDAGGPIYLIVHSPERGNSYWNGQVLVFGDKDDFIANKDDAYVLDIMAHEFAHAVTQYTAELEYEVQSGALNESFSDVFAVMVDREDWHLFEDNTNPRVVPQPWLRDMQDPSLGGNYDADNPQANFGQPSHMREYARLSNSRDEDWGGVHVNSGIPNHALYLAATASSREATEQIWYRALSTYLTPRSDFEDFAAALQRSAADLYTRNSREYTAVTNALVGVGILGSQALQPTPVPTAEPPVTINPTPAPVVTSGCSELVGNGTFESSRPDPWIEMTNLGAPLITEDFPRTGRQSVWLGGTDQESFQYVYQDVSLAANLRGVTLTYWHFIEENNVGDVPDAVFDALLADPRDGAVLTTLEEFFSSDPDFDWTQSTVDLTPYAGKKIRLAFTADMVRGNLSNFFVDDVSIAGCTGSSQSPTAGGQAVAVTGTITDSRTGKPIEGAEFYVLVDNLSVAQATQDGRLSDSEVQASGISDRRGRYQLDSRLPRGRRYNVVIIAGGYKTIAVDGALEITAVDPDPVVQDVVMQKR